MAIHFNTNNNISPLGETAIKRQTNQEPNIEINFRTSSTTGNAGTGAVPQNQPGDIDVDEFEKKHEAFVHPKYDNYTIIKAEIFGTDFSEEIGILTNKDGSVTVIRSDENKNKTYINVADKAEAYKLINALEKFDEPDSAKTLKKMAKQYNKGQSFYNIGTRGNGESVRNINLVQ